jgi:hypothetical protein
MRIQDNVIPIVSWFPSENDSSNNKNEEENHVKYPIDREQDSSIRYIIWLIFPPELWRYGYLESLLY